MRPGYRQKGVLCKNLEELGCWQKIEERPRQEKVRTDRGTCLEIPKQTAVGDFWGPVSRDREGTIENNLGLGGTSTKPGVIYFRKERCLPYNSESIIDRSLIVVRGELALRNAITDFQ